jgi:serine/threonine protein kinase
MTTSVSESTKQPQSSNVQLKEQLLQAGDLVGHCRVIELIAAGGMANVYKVWHEQLEVIRAIKILKPGFSDEAKGRLETEAKISANLRHPNIVEIYGMGFWNDIPFIEMEFIDGSSLKELLEKNIRLPVSFCLAVAHRVCTALQFAYNQDMTLYGKVYDRLIHRDIKPANILLTSKGVVKLADFGIARPSEVSIHTVGSKVMGTFAYLSPEQLNGEKLDQRSDVYSLGTVLYEMLTGSKTFPQKLLAELVQRKSRGQFIPVGSMGISLPRQLCCAIEKSLALDRTKRFCDAGEFDVDLTASLQKLTSKNPEEIIKAYLKNPYSPGINPRPPINTRLLIKVVITILIIAFVGIFLIKIVPKIQSKVRFLKKALTTEVVVSQTPTPAPQPLPVKESLPKVVKKAKVTTQPPAMDPMTAASNKFSLGDYSGAISAYENISPESLTPAKQSQRIMHLLQSYLYIGKIDEAQSLIITDPVADGLFYLLKSQVAVQKNDLANALYAAQRAYSLPSKFETSIRKKATYQIASILHALYVVKPNSDNLQQALDWWSTYLSKYCSDNDGSKECHEALENKSILEQ